MITLVLGGARSGKSALAERLCRQAEGPVTFVAAGGPVPPGDDDLLARVTAHQNRRPATWATVEVGAGSGLAEALAAARGTVLVDALGTWMAAHDDFVVDDVRLVTALAERPGDTVVVSDEVGLGVHPSSELGRRFRDALGLLNQRVAAASDRVLLVVAGRILPLVTVDG
jgi:adenosyl cobinamide kinase/adenosyl cobinamide phosphate guanylyltransferase